MDKYTATTPNFESLFLQKEETPIATNPEKNKLTITQTVWWEKNNLKKNP